MQCSSGGVEIHNHAHVGNGQDPIVPARYQAPGTNEQGNIVTVKPRLFQYRVEGVVSVHFVVFGGFQCLSAIVYCLWFTDDS